MTSGIRLAAIASLALASGALAQGTMHFTWTFGDNGDGDGVISPGEAAIVTLWADRDPLEVGYAGSIFDITGNDDWERGTIHSRENLIDSLGTGRGTLIGDNSITGIESFQLPPFFNPDFEAGNPVAIYRIEWTPDTYGVFFAEIISGNHQNASVYTDEFGTSVEYQPVPLAGVLAVVPGPAGVAVLGLAGWIGSRRKR